MRSTEKLRRLCDAEVSHPNQLSKRSLSFTGGLLELVGRAGSLDERAIAFYDVGISHNVGLTPSERGHGRRELRFFVKAVREVVGALADDAPLDSLDVLVESGSAVQRGQAHHHVIH